MTFTPIQTFFGGIFLHFATSDLLSETGRVFGISGIVDGAVNGRHEGWRWSVIVGILSWPALGRAIGLNELYPGDAVKTMSLISLPRLAFAGALVGVGSKLGSGCTSGHMLCGLSRLSRRSIIATTVFFTTAVATANIFPLHTSTSIPAYALEIPSLSVTLTLLGAAVAYKAVHSAIVAHISKLTRPSPITRTVPYLISGLAFSLGLSLSGMTDPSKVLGFLRFPSVDLFDPSLALVILGGVVPNAIHYAATLRTAEGIPKPRFTWESWSVPSRRHIDWRLIIGAAIFGVGWGLAGVCPGPALVNLGEALSGPVWSTSGDCLTRVATFLASMLAGMFVSGCI